MNSTDNHLYHKHIIAFGKPSGGARPIAIGDTIRRLTSKLLLLEFQDPVIEKLLPYQIGVSSPGGALHSIRHWASVHNSDSLFMVDFTNAFNSLDRSEINSNV